MPPEELVKRFELAAKRAGQTILDRLRDVTPRSTANAQTFCANIAPEEARRRALTDTHAPNRWRVNVVVPSFPELAAAFECPASSAMVRESRCRIW